MNRIVCITSLFVTSASLALACSPTIDVGQNDGGASSDAGSDAAATALSDAAASSPNLAKCEVACQAPSDGPCASTNVSACVEKCTALLEGLSVKCATCMVENAQYTGTKCVPSPCGSRCPDVKCDYPSCSGAGCAGVSSGGPTPCDPACTASDEKCDGIKLAGTTDTCAAACKDG